MWSISYYSLFNIVTKHFFLRWGLLRSPLSATFQYAVQSYSLGHHAVHHDLMTNLTIEGVSFDPLHPRYPLLHPASGNHQSLLCLFEFEFFRFQMYVRSFTVCLSLVWSGLIHVVTNDRVSFFFMALNNIPLGKYHILSIHSFVDGPLSCSISWLL